MFVNLLLLRKDLPIEIYVFVNDVRWVNYEEIQSDIFDHLLASLPIFELRAFQLPTDSSLLQIYRLYRDDGAQNYFLFIWIYFFTGCVDKGMELSDFSSDGCSLLLDGTFENPELWKECCLKHDIAYWRGGTEEA